jgi:chaperonin GroES
VNIFTPEKKLTINKDLMQAPNLCDRFSKEDLSRIGQISYQGYERDEQSRSKWVRRMNAAMDLSMQIQQDKNFPWAGCSNVIFPLVTIAALQFSARSYSNLIQGTDIVRYRVPGEDPTGALIEQADRISKHMSWQVLEQDTGWEEEHDRLLINLGIVGTNFIKTYYCPNRRSNISELVMARDFILDYNARSVENCVRKTQLFKLYPNEIYERVKRQTYQKDILNADWFIRGAPMQVDEKPEDNRKGMEPVVHPDNAPFKLLEQHRFLDLDGDGYAEPYIVTLEDNSKQVVRVVARWDREEDVQRDGKEIYCITPTEYYTKFSFIPSPDGGIYDIGFGVLLGPLNEAVNSGINQLLDSGTMQNSMGGFLGRGAKIRGGVYTMAPWEWKRVDSTGDDLRKSLVPFPERQPSTVMFNLLGLLINYTDRAAGTTDPMVGINPGQNTPAETSRNMIEQGSQIYNVVFKRVWRSLKQEFKKRHTLNAMFMPASFRFGSGNTMIRREDYLNNPDLVVPSADPNVTSMGARFAQAQMLRQASTTVPGYDIVQVERHFLKMMRIEGVDKFYPGPDKVPPLPNPQTALEELKLKGKQMQFQHEKQLLMIKMMEERKLNEAKIVELHAKAAKIVAEIGTSQATVQLQAFDSAVAALQAHNAMLGERIDSMMGEEGNEDNTGGVRAMASRPGNGGIPTGLEGMEGAAEGAMGEGPISG